jgi:hypothetical protein
MKKIVLFFVFLNISLGAQPKELVLNFHHTMDGQALTNALIGVNNLGNQFKYSRLQYYVDDIEIIYNQGDTFSYPGVLLIDALSEENTKVNLGSLDFNSISAVRFAVGVGPDLNNLDPSVYPTTHPLAPKFPSMHWGWAAGYRFVCAEGLGSSSFNQTFELHGLGNSNYAMQTILTAGTALGNDTLLINVEADYSELTKNITVASGTISHGETGDAFQALKNFNNDVFKSAEGNTALAVRENDGAALSIHPNPSNGEVFFTGMDGADLIIYNALGTVVYQSKLMESQPVLLKDSGMYLCLVSLNGLTKASKIVIR